MHNTALTLMCVELLGGTGGVDAGGGAGDVYVAPG